MHKKEIFLLFVLALLNVLRRDLRGICLPRQCLRRG